MKKTIIIANLIFIFIYSAQFFFVKRVQAETEAAGTIRKTAEYYPHRDPSDSVPWERYTDLNLNYVIGRVNADDLNYVQRFGTAKYIPLTVIYPPDAALLSQLAQYGTPRYAICFNEENPGYHAGWSTATTEKYLVSCINGFRQQWPNVKIIVNLGAQVDRCPRASCVDYRGVTVGYMDMTDHFPRWPNKVWQAFANHINDIYAFGVHYYPDGYTCDAVNPSDPAKPLKNDYFTQETTVPGWKPFGNITDDGTYIACTKRFINIAKNFLASKRVTKPIAITEWGISTVNSANTTAPNWNSSTRWNGFWNMLKNQSNLLLLSVYSTVWRCDDGSCLIPGSLVNPSTGLLYPYGSAYAQIPPYAKP